jgi:hypothetical protein
MILSEKKSFTKDKVTFIFRARHALRREALDALFDHHIHPDLRGVVDWEIA